LSKFNRTTHFTQSEGGGADCGHLLFNIHAVFFDRVQARG